MITQRLTFLFTSDEHGFVTAQSKLQGQVKSARQENPNGTLLVSSGDVFEGSAENGVLGLEASRAMMEAAGYDVMTVGNHDFDHGAEVARQWIKESKASVLVSNLHDADTGLPLENTASSQVFELNGVKVGLIGVTTPETVAILPASKLQGLQFSEPVGRVRAEVEKLRAQGVELLGLVSHLGLPIDRQMAEAVPELDFILGGHTHDSLTEPERVGQTLIAHPGSFRRAIGRLDLDVCPNTSEIEGFDYRLIPSAPEPADQGAVGLLAEEYQARVASAMGEVIATLPEGLDYNPNVLGDGMEGFLSEAALAKGPVDFVMVNQKSLRAGLKRGEVTLGDVFNVSPFDNRLVQLQMTADEAAALHAESLRRLDQTSLTLGGNKRIAAQLSDRSLGVVEDVPLGQAGPLSLAAEAGAEDTSVNCFVGGLRETDVVTLDYLVQGGLNYFQPGQPIASDLGLTRDVLADHLRQAYPRT